MPRPLPALPLLWALCAGCLASTREEIVRVSREFNNDLRWGRLEHVLPRMAPPLRARFSAQAAALGEDLEFLDNEVTGIDVQPGPKGRDVAVCRVDLSWTNRRTGIVERATIGEQWASAGGRGWVLERMVRLRGARLPLFDEAPLSKAPAQEPPRPAQPAPGEGLPTRDPAQEGDPLER